ncbi:restriction endonuclease subunit S [Shewanella sp. SM72]|uniref:restriction endonuclease subunit S n=1 Tax=unclassified Shewanella TaxID=196818 RepID=UPI0021D87A7C|nr:MULTISPECIES: restriction endonuclease subunit S [unclassified Shewanella]MCU8019363.1 restriction endonuclease subunit S [Shewanella sp. SM72]MCU8022796.1 restriction endonuclease subunit S [Shewanella sp. SM78]MCU8079787.1 restriction endonuclease subunit S [Shewanella sp. SM103]
MSVEKNVPQIRFKDFAGEWLDTTLSDVIDVRSGKDYKHLGKGNIPVYGTGGYMLSVDSALSNDEDAIGIGRKGTIDKPYLLRAPFWTVDTLFYAVPKPKFKLDYLYCLFQKIDWKKHDESTGVPSLSKVAINNIPVRVTSETEQTAIGNTFQKLDNLINQHQQKHDKLSNIKKAMLEKMFPKQGENIPEIRFKGFSGEWEEIELSDEVTFINGRAYSQEELLDKGKYTVLRVGNFYTNSSWYYSDLELGDKYYADNGDLLYTWSASFGPHIWNGDKVIYHYHIWKLELSENIDKLFLLHLLDYDRAKILSGSNGSTMIHITKSAMEAKKVFIPKKDEQIVIGNYFQKLDVLIKHHQQQITKLNNIKQACLSKMFV